MIDVVAEVAWPNGGIMALCFASGAAAGWGFNQRTVVKLNNERLNLVMQELEELRVRLRLVEDDRLSIAMGRRHLDRGDEE
jgi:hypothetical protein